MAIILLFFYGAVSVVDLPERAAPKPCLMKQQVIILFCIIKMQSTHMLIVSHIGIVNVFR